MIVFEANYSKKLGLPSYSSHQYSVTIRTELADLNQLNEQSEEIHALLQSAVNGSVPLFYAFSDFSSWSRSNPQFGLALILPHSYSRRIHVNYPPSTNNKTPTGAESSALSTKPNNLRTLKRHSDRAPIPGLADCFKPVTRAEDHHRLRI